MSDDSKMARARELIQQKRYREARQLLRGVDHPKAKDWITKLDARLDDPFEDCRAWLDRRTKSGKSKAKIRRLGGEKAGVTVKAEVKHEAFDLMTEPFWDNPTIISFAKSWGQVLDGETHDISTLWKDED